MEVCPLSHEVMLQPLSVPITGSAFAFSIFLLPAFHKVSLYNLAIQKIVDEIFFRNHERSSDFQAANSMLMDSSDDGSLAFETE